MYDNKENNFKKKGLCISLCAALVCGLGIGGVYYKTNKSPQNDGTKLFSDSSAGRLSADADKKADSSNDKKTEENTENKTGRELVVFRDSFASSFVPLLVEGYDKITLIDTRYISPKILSQYIEFNDQDILFLYSTSIINNSYTLK